MSIYAIVIDSGSDIPARNLADWDVLCVPLTFSFKGTDGEFTNRDMDAREFFGRMRGGQVALTSAPSAGAFEAAFRAELGAGRDVLYLGFSSGLSSTSETAAMVAKSLRSEYPERRIVAMDTLCASVGLGLLVGLCAARRAEGMPLDEVAAYAERTAARVCHWFTVDDLAYLRRGGRIGGIASAFAALANVKPILHAGEAGGLECAAKARGRHRAIAALARKLAEGRGPDESTPVLVGHCDCADDAALLAEILDSQYGIPVDDVWEIGPVIGAHSGPGTLALFYIGSNR